MLPALKYPGDTTTGQLLPSGQYTDTLPHAVGTVEPATQKYPDGHTPLHVDTFRPVLLPYRPAAHSVHVTARASLNVPAGHSVDGDSSPVPSPQYRPPGHLLLSPDDVPAGQKLPAGHTTAVLFVDPAGQ